MNNLYNKFINSGLDYSVISLESTENYYPYWCYPENATPIGLEGCILYCFIDGYDDMVFAANPESCADINVYPVARSFEDFLGLILACTEANPVEQIIWMNETQFSQHVKNEKEIYKKEKEPILQFIGSLGVKEINDPFSYVKELQKDFDYSKIIFSDEYYDILGIER
ncbi:MAG: hypothetical protein E7218_02230 [Anaerofustis stercorihominis]|nr:hypothetical protein [Anaerofustis stercorihominis]